MTADREWQVACDAAGSVAVAERELGERFAGSRIDQDRRQVVVLVVVREQDPADRARRLDADQRRIVGGRGQVVDRSVRVEAVAHSFAELVGVKEAAIGVARRLGSRALTGASIDQVRNAVVLYLDPSLREDADAITAALPSDSYVVVEDVLRFDLE